MTTPAQREAVARVLYEGVTGNPWEAAEILGNNRSRSYWHGWRNGRVDGGHDKGDQAMQALARAVVGRERMRNGGGR